MAGSRLALLVLETGVVVRSADGYRLTEYVPYTDETRYRSRWLRGPFSPVQGNLDHLLKPGSKIPSELLARQNEIYRKRPI